VQSKSQRKVKGLGGIVFLCLLWGIAASAERVKVAVVSFSPPQDAPVNVSQSVINRYKDETAGALEAHIRTAASNGARLIVTPEFGTVGYPATPGLPPEEQEFQNRDEIQPYVETMSGKTVKRFGSLANELNVWLVIGFAEHETSTDRYFNTLVGFNPEGKVVRKYRKIHLFEGETKFLSAGDSRSYFDTEFGRVGMFTCYDIHFGNPAGDLVSKDHAEIIAFGTSWVGKNGMSVFRQFAESHHVYMLAANHTYFPDSGVISPDGEIQSHTQADGPVYGYVEITRRGR
jgi:predicted amidohydrolase